MSNARYQKQARERARREKAAAKRDRREELRAAAADRAPQSPVASEHEVLERLADVHHRFDAGELDFESFERLKQELTEQLDI